MTTPLPSSTWIESMAYKRVNEIPWLVFFLHPYTNTNGIPQEPRVIIFGGPDSDLPSWLPGLVRAGRVRTAKGKVNSPGAVYHRLVKKYSHQVVVGEDKVREIKEMMK